MKATSVAKEWGNSRLKGFLALSRTPHALLDMATPALAALLWLGGFPSPRVVVLGLATAFAGYLAVYALNDLAGYAHDRRKIQAGRGRPPTADLDAILVLHPMAHGLLSYREGLLWTGFWAALALLGSYLLNPSCMLIFITASLLEVIYCLLLRVTYARGLISGIVKISGGIAAVFAVDPHPSPLFLGLLFLWFFFWEIGGQNIPNDWADLEEDLSLKAETIPVRFGPEVSIRMIHLCLLAVIAFSLAIPWASPANFGDSYWLGALLAGIYLLLLPAYRLRRRRTPQESFALFNRASYYPLAMLLVIIISLYLRP